MNKKILIVFIIAFVTITSATYVLSEIKNESLDDEDSCLEKSDGTRECDNTCSWCYYTYYTCDTRGICC
ncbi:MAG: hypothetical protein PHT94_04205 [Candidatus Nanoarchaeia archaeon]|nr:hypothetical protein [Candidatus Nanoarchaeia archaeon]